MQTTEKNSTVGHRTRSAATFVLAFALAVGLALGMLTLFGDSAPNPVADEGGPASSIVASIAFLVVAAFLALVVHEVGHAIGGRLHGMRLGMLIVGPVHVQREADGRLGWRLNRRLSLAGDVEGAFEKLREAYATLASKWNWGNESSMAEIRRLCLARGLPDPGGAE